MLKRNSARIILGVIIVSSIFLVTTTTLQTRSYSSFVDTIEDSYFKVLNLESGVAYNFTVDVEEYYQMDLGFSIHLDDRPKARNALVTVDNPGTSDESTIFTPEEAGDYYVRTFSNYDWGFFEITVFESETTNEKIVEPYLMPINWQWLWITAAVIGGMIVISIIVGLSAMLFKRVDWGRICLPKISVDWDGFRARRRTRVAQRKIRGEYRRSKFRREKTIRKTRVRTKRRKGKSQEEMEFELDYEPIEQSVSIVYVSNPKPKCMVSGLYIEFEEDEVLACPNCQNIAKKPMLAEWLRVKGTCPICKTRLILESCKQAKLNLE